MIDFRHVTAHLGYTGLVAGHVWECTHLVTNTTNAIVIVEREVGTLATPEAPRIDASAVFIQWQWAIIDVPACLCVEARSEWIGCWALLPTIIAVAREIVVVTPCGFEVLTPTVLPAIHVDAIINVHASWCALEGPVCLARDLICFGSEWRPGIVTRVQRISTIAGVRQS
jgi:hypothetical protein